MCECPHPVTKLLRPSQGRGRQERKAASEGRIAMPFGLKLRRTRRYNVLSKNCFVTRIRLLDSNVIECTLSVESTGQECLEAVAQRLELREVRAGVREGVRARTLPGPATCPSLASRRILLSLARARSYSLCASGGLLRCRAEQGPGPEPCTGWWLPLCSRR